MKKFLKVLGILTILLIVLVVSVILLNPWMDRWGATDAEFNATPECLDIACRER